MITSVKGNLLEDSAQALVNTVNIVGVMGKGIALQFREKFPENYNIYRKVCKEGKLGIGQMLITEERTLASTKLIVNFPTKTTWRKPSEYIYIEQGLQALRHEILSRHIESIAIPPLGSHNGGLDWNRVRKMIVDALGNLPCDIRLYEPSEVIVEQMKKERVKFTPARAMLLSMMCDQVSYGEFASVFSAEKIVYFLQRFGAEKYFNINFERYYYGPYSKGKIAHVLYYLNGSYIKGMGGMQAKPFQEIWMMDDTKEEAENFLKQEEYAECWSIVQETKNFLRGYYSQYTLELLATIDYILCADPSLKAWGTMNPEQVKLHVNKDISEWSSRKNRIFAGTKHVDIILNHLKENYGRLF